MDYKTLAYMQERVVKSNVIIEKMSSLRKTAIALVDGESISFINASNSQVASLSYRSYNGGRNSRDLVQEIRTFTVEAINREIVRLEKELEEI